MPADSSNSDASFLPFILLHRDNDPCVRVHTATLTRRLLSSLPAPLAASFAACLEDRLLVVLRPMSSDDSEDETTAHMVGAVYSTFSVLLATSPPNYDMFLVLWGLAFSFLTIQCLKYQESHRGQAERHHHLMSAIFLLGEIASTCITRSKPVFLLCREGRGFSLHLVKAVLRRVAIARGFSYVVHSYFLIF